MYSVDRHSGRHDLHCLPGSGMPFHVGLIIGARYVNHRLGTLSMWYHSTLLHERGGQKTTTALTATISTTTAFHAAIDPHGQCRSGRHQSLAGQRHQGASADGGHRAHRPIQSLMVFLFSTFCIPWSKKKKKNKYKNIYNS